MGKLYKINNFLSVNDEKEINDTVLQFKINIVTEDKMLMFMVTSYVYGVKSGIESKRISPEEADKLLSEAGLSEISYEILQDLKYKIGGYYTDDALQKRYDSLVDTKYFDICLDIFKRIKNEINNVKQQSKETNQNDIEETI